MTDSYALAAARIAAAALINAAGFDVCQQSCVDVLADLLLKYVREVGAGSHHFAELAGRTETNPVDVVRRSACADGSEGAIGSAIDSPLPALQALALNDMGTSVAQLREFVRQSQVRGARPLAARGVRCAAPASPRRAHAHGTRRRVQEVPFEHSIASFPLRKQSRPAPSFLERGEAPPPHIPPWLPALPDRHAHLASPVYPGASMLLALAQCWHSAVPALLAQRAPVAVPAPIPPRLHRAVHEKDPQRRQVLLTEQRQQAQQAAVRLQARLTASGNRLLAEELVGEGTADGEGGSTDAGGQMQHSQGVAAATGASNPFLAPAADPQQAAPGAHELAGALPCAAWRCHSLSPLS